LAAAAVVVTVSSLRPMVAVAVPVVTETRLLVKQLAVTARQKILCR
jgi:hypothetical protein